jgi:methyltransferase-like protein 6
MNDAVKNIKSVLKVGGVILIRDYGQYDCAQLRFKKGHKCQENLYVRQDGTFSYYFTTEFIQELFTRNGFDVIENGYIRKTVLNRKESIRLNRIFVQSKFRLRE